MVLIKSARVTDRIQTCTISNSDPLGQDIRKHRLKTSLVHSPREFLSLLSPDRRQDTASGRAEMAVRVWHVVGVSLPVCLSARMVMQCHCWGQKQWQSRRSAGSRVRYEVWCRNITANETISESADSAFGVNFQ
ncbi:hypothetical protein J6590_094909 [Homalodisca vitripennis]|nr:hypothetical protein J6590_094909 [Homalodisca vitripennis]